MSVFHIKTSPTAAMSSLLVVGMRGQFLQTNYAAASAGVLGARWVVPAGLLEFRVAVKVETRGLRRRLLDN